MHDWKTRALSPEALEAKWEDDMHMEPGADVGYTGPVANNIDQDAEPQSNPAATDGGAKNFKELQTQTW